MSVEPGELLLNELETLRELLSGLPEVATEDGQRVAPERMSVRVWRLPRGFDRMRRVNPLMATLLDTGALTVHRRMVRIADVRSGDIGAGTGIDWYIGKGIQGSMATHQKRRPIDGEEMPAFDIVVHRVDLQGEDLGLEGIRGAERRRHELHLSQAEVGILCSVYGSAAAVPLWHKDAPFGAICVDTSYGTELSRPALSAIVARLLITEPRLTLLIRGMYRNVREAIRQDTPGGNPSP